MEDIKNRKYVARLVYAVLTERKTAREAILLFPLAEGKSLPRNIIADYEPYYHGVSRRWENGTKGFWKEFLRFINL